MTPHHPSVTGPGRVTGHVSVAGHRRVTAHRDRIAGLLAPLADLPLHRVPLSAGLGAALGEDLVAPVSLPPFDNSQMDGFAVRSADFRGDLDGGPRAFTVADPIPAGAVPAPLAPGHAAPIMTGAMMPPGADAVVPVERAVPSTYPAPGETVGLPPVEAGTYVRRAGSDVEAGAVVLRAGAALGAAQIGLAAGLGIEDVPVRPALRAVVVSTGAELAAPGTALAPGQIHDANGPLLAAALRESGLTVGNVAVRSDEPGELRRELRGLARLGAEDRPDLVITTGGVSKGAFEATKLALAGSDVEFSHLAMQPGGPQGLGTFEGLPIIAFPGNPVSCWISWEVLLRPVLSELLGAPRHRRVLRAPLAHGLASPAGKLQVRRARLRRDGAAELVGGPGSHLLGALAASDALVMVPEDVTELPAGAEVEVWLT
ncbi:putative molybdopterin biosynthesis protein MoeA [Sinomonas cyclohexanicum]|uniref:Molybdopterin molybdenumtransferase n=1 Tax=Sinomonas cyclohexanicum TaxID=322009 RepID=A0ABM7PU24_SINCY|nr:gephyrin-like molybdotransferase Glp [Corynebacterium cyclohexanicum]BCT75754.1 putative molybdopterin biosynthesis protein MoeA [Corynebacterium cyclohexanicum]